MIRWSVLKRSKNHKRAVQNLMFFYNWKKAVKYVYVTQQKKNKESEDSPWGSCNKANPPWEDTVKLRLEKLESEQVFPIERRW